MQSVCPRNGGRIAPVLEFLHHRAKNFTTERRSDLLDDDRRWSWASKHQWAWHAVLVAEVKGLSEEAPDS